jgi:hypothetical protein
MLQNFILIVFLCIGGFLYGEDNTLHDRSISDVNLISGSKATNIPYGFYINGFQKSSIEAFKNVDLTQYPNKKLFVGYGVYDVDDKNCRYLDIPSNNELPQHVKNIKTLGNNTYGVSFSRMTFSQCKALASKFSGYVYTPMNASEYQAVMDALNNTAGGETPKDFWVGYLRSDCSSSYLNDEGYSQSYVRFRFKNEICNDSNKLTFTNAGSRVWMRTGSTDEHYCPIVIHSPDYLRPIKYCAPWWRIERSWKLKETDGLYKLNGRTYDFRYAKYIIDYPKDITICTETNASFANDESNGRFQFTCRSYDDIKASPACLESITLPQCHVNECQGYAENTCVKVDEIRPFKDYDVGYILKDGVETKVKTRDNKLINIYDCPSPNPPSSNCLKKEIVSVLPVECPNSQCAELADCFKDETIPNDKCLTQYKCEKSYGSVDNVIYKDGSVYALGGVCSDGSQVTALIERKSGIKRKCLQYNEYVETNSTIKKCTSTANSTFKTVDAAITDVDIYQDDSRCIRINNIEEARPKIETVFKYKTEGFFKTSIQKAYIDGSSENNELNSTQYLLAAASIYLKPYAQESSAEPKVEENTLQQFCKDTFSDNWYNKRYYSLKDSSLKGFVYNKTGQSTRVIKVYSAYSSSLHSVADDFGASYKSSNWGIAVFDKNIKITDYRSFDISSSVGSATKMKNFLTSLPDETLVAIHTFGDPKTNVSGNTALKNALALYGADKTILSNLKTSSAYLLVGKKGSSRLKEKVNSASNASVYSVIDLPVSIPHVLAISDSSSCTTNANTLQMVDFTPSYKDYNFNDIGITKSDVNTHRYCFLGGNTIQGDGGISSIKGVSGTDLYFNLPISANKTCEDYSKCLAGEMISTAKCKIHVNSETQELPEDEPTIPGNITPHVTTMVTQEGSFLSDINGFKDIFAVQEYTEGSFGYISNYLFRLPKNNTIWIDNKEVSPIIGQTPVIYPELYDYNNGQHTEKTKNRTPSNVKASYSGLTAATTWNGDNGVSGNGLLYGVALVGIMYMLGGTGVGLLLALVVVIVMMFMGTQSWGWYDTTYKIYQELTLSSKYVENIYGYDPRVVENGALTWSRESAHSGTLKKGDYVRFRNLAISSKKTYFLNLGFSADMVQDKMTSAAEKSFVGWKKIDWYELSAKKGDALVSSGNRVKISKPVNTIFMGAVNMVSIVVPYKGEYEVIAYDKKDNILGAVVVQEQNFMRNTTSTSGNIAQTYAKVQFATADNFNIAPGQDKQMINGSCLSSNFVEWGGGVSGAYYEKGAPDLGSQGNDCKKSNDVYVVEHSAVKLTIRPIDSTDVFTIKLIKPLPFPNRVFLVNLMNLENRKYQCYDNLEPCSIIKNP